jgi:hypothetical protein
MTALSGSQSIPPAEPEVNDSRPRMIWNILSNLVVFSGYAKELVLG